MNYFSILRGINVGGNRKLLMADLKAIYQGLNFENVQTYIQSGNVVFSASNDLDTKAVSDQISQVIQKTFGYDVPVITRPIVTLVKDVKNSPYQLEDSSKLHLTFLSERPTEALAQSFAEISKAPDEFKLMNDNVFLCLHGKYSDTKLTNNFIEKKLNVKATNRNWKTVLKLIELGTK
ncbi:MAG: DUF1697 domain-containing protein [Putridiphycobacter sp.]